MILRKKLPKKGQFGFLTSLFTDTPPKPAYKTKSIAKLKHTPPSLRPRTGGVFDFDIQAHDVGKNPKYLEIPTKTKTGMFRCSGSALDACRDIYDWRNKIQIGYQTLNKSVPAGYTNAWNIKNAIKTSGAGTFFYDRDRDGPLTARDLRIIKKHGSKGAIYGWGDASGDYIDDGGPRRSRHITTTLGRDVDGDSVMYDFGRTNSYEDFYNRSHDAPVEDITFINLPDDRSVKVPNFIAIPAGSKNMHNLQYYRKMYKL